MAKRAVIIFIACVLVYLAFFGLDQHLRIRRGPWSIAFTNEISGEPSIIISQPRLNISGVRLIAVGERIAVTNSAATVVVDGPPGEIPFGKIIFFDTTYLPGTITLDLFGHGVELVPRVLRVDRKEIPWQSGTVIRMEPSDRINPKPIQRKRLI